MKWTAAGILAVILAMMLLLAGTWAFWSIRAMTWTATHAGRYYPASYEWSQYKERLAFEKRHRLLPEARNGLRIAINEWPDWNYYLVLELQGKGALIAVPITDNAAPPAYERSFVLKQSEIQTLLRIFDRHTTGFLGTNNTCVDGTAFTFERWKKGKPTHGRGNAACDTHYANLRNLLAAFLMDDMRDAPFDWQEWILEEHLIRDWQANR